MNSENINIKDNSIIIQEDEIIKDANHLLNILTSNIKIFNDKKTKFQNKNDYEFIIRIFKNMDKNEFIHFFRYFNQINIPILKLLINGYIEFDFDQETNGNAILEIISKGIKINFNKNLFYFIYKKLSKNFRRHNLLKDIQAIKKFGKLFTIWKLLYNIENPIDNFDLNNLSSLIKFQNLKEEKKFIELTIDDQNEMINLIISINFVDSPILNINIINEKFSFLKLYNDTEIFEIKYNDINLGKEKNIASFSNIFKIKFCFYKKGFEIYINKNIKIPFKEFNFNMNSLKKIEILNNFIGEVSSIKVKKNYNKLEYCEMVEPLKIKIYKENINNNIGIKTNAFKMPIKKEKKNSDNKNKLYLYQFSGASISIKINYESIENNENLIKGKIDLSEIEYIGGLNCFIPIFKIINYIINNLELLYNDKKYQDEKEKLNILSEINICIDESFQQVKDILKIILKMICLSEGNYKNIRKIIVPLIGSLAEISHSLHKLSNSNIISIDKISLLFQDEVFSSLYIFLLISSYPYNIKEMYRKIIGINSNFDNLIISIDSIIFDIEKSHFKNLDWYFIILIIFIEFIFIYFEFSKKVPNKLVNIIEQISFFLSKNLDMKNVDAIKKQEAIKNISNIIHKFHKEEEINLENLTNDKNILKDNNYYFKYIIYMATSFLNIKLILKKNKCEINKNSFYDKFLKLIENYSKNKGIINITDDYIQMIINFKYYPKELSFIQKLFPFLSENDFYSENELIIEEFIDYHSEYHHLMKELFIFNRLWSKQRSFFNIFLDKIKKSKIKYKNLNYYTRNFQRPIIYPVLDYKHRYPEFSDFKIDKDFYIIEEDTDDFNFDLDCPELDTLIEEYNKEIFEIIEKNKEISTYEVCLVKQTHHVKGKLFFVIDNNKFIIYFYSYNYKIQSNENKILCCNKTNDEEINEKGDISKENMKNILCYGAVFKCPKKDSNIKIKIVLDDIRLVLSRIYFYRNSALEIFTETKSYYFNFFSKRIKDCILSTFMNPCQKSYFPINLDDNIIGYIKVNQKIIKKYKFLDLTAKKNNLIEFISDKTSKGELCEMCVFDIIIIINLISNRSFNDLYQYPIFPLLCLYDKKNDKYNDRDFKEHIGFQENTDKSKERKSLFVQIYQDNYDDNEDNSSVYCFNTHYSNSVYTSNYLIRLFPYSFLSIEFSGKGFDDPNRLFFSIDGSFYNTSMQKSDLRELIPEFFYFPEMYMNINYINFHKKNDDEYVDDVIMSKKLLEKLEKFKVINNEIKYKEIIQDDFNILFTDKNIKKEEYKKCFIFIELMKNKLEILSKDLGPWLNIIFGNNQKTSNKNQQYFRTESYITLKNDCKNYLNDDIIMTSVEFGLIPLQTIFDSKILNNLEKRKSSEYDKNIEKELYNTNIFNKRKCSSSKSLNDENYFNNEFNDYWDEKLKYDFQIKNENNFGKLEVYNNNYLIGEIIDHNDIIIDKFYNRRLNMFATTSYDGFICIYILPNKLFSMIRHPLKLFYDKIYLSANPFPTIIGYEKSENILTSYSLSGMIIKRVKIEVKNEDKNRKVIIEPIFNMYGGAFKDKLKIIIKSDKKIINLYYNIPFFDLEFKDIIN